MYGSGNRHAGSRGVGRAPQGGGPPAKPPVRSQCSSRVDVRYVGC